LLSTPYLILYDGDIAMGTLRNSTPIPNFGSCILFDRHRRHRRHDRIASIAPESHTWHTIFANHRVGIRMWPSIDRHYAGPYGRHRLINSIGACQLGSVERIKSCLISPLSNVHNKLKKRHLIGALGGQLTPSPSVFVNDIRQNRLIG
jgi:hypothetical protein